MREWNLKAGDPLSLTLAADTSVEGTDYADDQIWELSLGGGEPAALAVQTTYGLRARALRLFPRFVEGDQEQSDPAGFSRPPVIKHLYPNFVALSFSPFPDIDVEAEYWVPLSKGIAGRIQLANHGQVPRQIRLEWIGQLAPSEGQRLAAEEIQAVPVLCGQTGGLSPVVFLTGGAQAGTRSYPSLNLTLDLEPGSARRITWAEAALQSSEESFVLVRSLAARKWDSELARLDLQNAGLIEIYSGDPDWDAAFMLAQKVAFGLFVGPTSHLPQPSFVLSRQPDQGFSLRKDGSDYNHLWNGQTPLEAYYLASLILPSAPLLAKGLLQNYLAVQTETGFIDWKPGMAGQRSRLMATPILASLAWRIYCATGDRAFVEEVFPGLLRFVMAWFKVDCDRDGDGIPEWDHPMQAGVDDHPVYSHWHIWSQGVDIATAEGPALCALLACECKALADMADLLERSGPISALLSLADQLKTAVEAAWDPEVGSYFDWCRDTHYCTRGELLGERQGPGSITIQRSFEHPVRILARIHTSGESTRRPQVIARGVGATGQHRVERITDESFHWYLGHGNLTGERVYLALESVDLQGLDPDDQVSLYSVDYHCLEQSVLLPLWAGFPDAERAAQLIERTITNPERFWHPFGLPACPNPPAEDEAGICQNVHLPWNALIGEGLVNYGYRSEAAELVTRIMNAIIQTLKREGAFRRYYQSYTGHGSGERNSLNGLAPLGLFLEVLGVRLISPQSVALDGFNPFPWPVTVKYRGMTVLRQKEKTIVVFQDGQTVVVTDPAPRTISLQIEPV